MLFHGRACKSRCFALEAVRLRSANKDVDDTSAEAAMNQLLEGASDRAAADDDIASACESRSRLAMRRTHLSPART